MKIWWVTIPAPVLRGMREHPQSPVQAHDQWRERPPIRKASWRCRCGGCGIWTKRFSRDRKVADNLQVKEGVVGDGEWRKRCVLCLNPEEAERQRRHRDEVLAGLRAELALLAARDTDHPKAGCALLTSRRYSRYLSTDEAGRPHLDSRKIAHAARFDGKFVVITNDDTLSAEDVGLGYKGGAVIECCFRRSKQPGLDVRPMYHLGPRRIEAHVRLCVLALQMHRAAELRCSLPWARIAHILAGLKAVRYQIEGRTIVQRTKISPDAAEILKNLGISMLKKLLSVTEPAPTQAAV